MLGALNVSLDGTPWHNGPNASKDDGTGRSDRRFADWNAVFAHPIGRTRFDNDGRARRQRSLPKHLVVVGKGEITSATKLEDDKVRSGHKVDFLVSMHADEIVVVFV
jgi:hypothetical protein